MSRTCNDQILGGIQEDGRKMNHLIHCAVSLVEAGIGRENFFNTLILANPQFHGNR
ncbi:hypothetical protein ACFL5K_00185 [Gemmatimonadota bacterium]